MRTIDDTSFSRFHAKTVQATYGLTPTSTQYNHFKLL